MCYTFSLGPTHSPLVFVLPAKWFGVLHLFFLVRQALPFHSASLSHLYVFGCLDISLASVVWLCHHVLLMVMSMIALTLFSPVKIVLLYFPVAVSGSSFIYLQVSFTGKESVLFELSCL